MVSSQVERSATGLRNRAPITTLYRVGRHVSEALSLELSDVDQRERTIASSRGGRSRRLALDAGSFRAIERWIERRSETGIPVEAPLF